MVLRRVEAWCRPCRRHGDADPDRPIENIDPQAWLPAILVRLNDHAIHRIDKLLRWNWAAEMERRKLAA
jgi:hypothetical protein